MGEPHNGPDSVDNVICLCPNDHVLFDRGVIGIEQDGSIIDRLSGQRLGELAHRKGHEVDPAHARHQWSVSLPERPDPLAATPAAEVGLRGPAQTTRSRWNFSRMPTMPVH